MIKQGEDWSTNCSINSKDKDDYKLAVEAINKVNKDRIHRLNQNQDNTGNMPPAVY